MGTYSAPRLESRKAEVTLKELAMLRSGRSTPWI